MSFSNRIVLPVVAVLSLAFLAACGNNTHSVTPPPSGAFSNSNLKGTYVFAITGADAANDFVTMTGAFAADGNGGITGGAMDFNDTGFTPSPNTSITGGNYKVTQDGRGQAQLTTATPWGAANIKVDFVLSTSAHGFITQFDGNGTGSGTLDLQTAASQPAAGTYVLGISGISGSSFASGAIAGAITLASDGTATGSFDYNSAGSPFLYSLNTGSNVTVSGTPGTATLVTNGGPTLSFDIYAIDATHLKFIETDQFPNLSGDLFLQTSSTFPSNQIVFTMAGFDGTVGGPMVMGGLMTSNGTSTISSGEEDFNDVGSVDSTNAGAPQSFSGSIGAPSGSRYVLTLNTFVNGNSVPSTYSFAAYPYGSGVELVEIDGAGVTSGVAYSQSATSLASAQGYGMNLQGANLGGGFEEDDIMEFTTTSTGFSGGIDLNDQNVALNFDKNFNGNYTMDSPATGRGVFTSNFLNGAIYVVSGTQILFLETDTNQLGLGALEQQNASADSSSLAQHHLAVIKAALAVKNVKKAKQLK